MNWIIWIVIISVMAAAAFVIISIKNHDPFDKDGL